MPTVIALELPPSINALWRSSRGRVHRSKRYRDWQRSAGWELVAQRPARIAGPVAIRIAVGPPDRRRRDIDNIGKALLDRLVAHQVIEDDAMVVKLITAVPAGIVRVTIEPAKVMGCAKA